MWLAHLAGVSGELVRCGLSADERRRAQRILPQGRRLSWARSRALLRELLGRYLDTPPGDLRFGSGPHGKPELMAAPQASRLRFSVSHSGMLAMYAFALGGEVGVDVQVGLPRDRHASSLARRILGPTAATRLASLPASQRSREVLAGWVRHEAQVKCLGTGLGAPAAGRRPWVMEVAISGDEPVAAALAAERRPSRVRRLIWDPGGARPATAAPRALEDPDGDRLGERLAVDHSRHQRVQAVSLA